MRSFHENNMHRLVPRCNPATVFIEEFINVCLWVLVIIVEEDDRRISWVKKRAVRARDWFKKDVIIFVMFKDSVFYNWFTRF